MVTISQTNHNDNDDGVIIIDWNDLINDNANYLSNVIERAYGCSNSIGVLAIRNVPNFLQSKREFFQLIYPFIHDIPDSDKELYLTSSETLYNTGWSYGKEMLKRDGNNIPDTSKGSYYYNPITDTPGTPNDRIQYPLSYPTNIWPNEEKYRTLSGFKEKAKHIGIILKQVVTEIAKHIDQYVVSKQKHEEEMKLQKESGGIIVTNNHIRYEKNFLYNQFYNTDKVKGRLLYYYPLLKNNNIITESNKEKNNVVNNNETTTTVKEDSWIGWHNDSGFLTGLAGDMYIDHNTAEMIDDNIIHDTIDPNVGLYILRKNNNGEDIIQKIRIPYDCCAVQIGECLQIITGGIIRATPHCVRGINPMNNTNTVHKNIARISVPCFVDTKPSFPLQCYVSTRNYHDIYQTSINTNKVPPLQLRWKPVDQPWDDDDDNNNTENNKTDIMTFGDFLKTTFQMYYEWNNA